MKKAQTERRRSGVTLVELLLVVALLAVVAAVAAPQFFRSSSEAVADARLERFKRSYATIRAAVSTQISMAGDTEMLMNATSDGPVSDSDSRLAKLVSSGYLDLASTQIENAKGETLMMSLFDAGATGIDTTLPANNQKLLRLHVRVLYANLGNSFDVDAYLRTGKTLDQAWADYVKDLNP